MIRTAAISIAAWVASISAWLAIREIRWLYWRDRCRVAEVERDHHRRTATWLKQEAEEALRAAAYWQQQAGGHVEALRKIGAL